MPRVTLSYRRDDSAPTARLIFERLRAYYGPESVFMDIDSIEFGEDFRERIHHALRQTDYLLVLIGPRWLGPTGDRNRINEENDPVRMEVERALEIGLRVVPILLDGAPMPTPQLLPQSLGKLPFINAADITTGRDFDSQIERIIRFIDRTFAETEARRAREAEEQLAAIPGNESAKAQASADVAPSKATSTPPNSEPTQATAAPPTGKQTANSRSTLLLIVAAVVGCAAVAFGLFEMFSHGTTAPVVAFATSSPAAISTPHETPRPTHRPRAQPTQKPTPRPAPPQATLRPVQTPTPRVIYVPAATKPVAKPKVANAGPAVRSTPVAVVTFVYLAPTAAPTLPPTPAPTPEPVVPSAGLFIGTWMREDGISYVVGAGGSLLVRDRDGSIEHWRYTWTWVGGLKYIVTDYANNGVPDPDYAEMTISPDGKSMQAHQVRSGALANFQRLP